MFCPIIIHCTVYLAWENSRHFTTLPLRSFPVNWRLRNDCWNSILMTCYYPDLDRASDWMKHISLVARPISTTQIWVVRRHQYGIFCARFSDVISRGNQLWRSEMSAVFLGHCLLNLLRRRFKESSYFVPTPTNACSTDNNIPFQV